MAQSIINVGAYDGQLTVNTVLPASGQNVTTAIMDLQATAPNSAAWRQGRFMILFPNLPENVVAAGITVTLQAAAPSLTASGIAPALSVPGTFAAPVTSQVSTIAGVAGQGSAAQIAWQTLAFDPTGSTYQYYQWVIAVSAGINTMGENIQISWVKDSP